MTLSAPMISGVLSTISRSIRLKGQFPGGDIEVLRNFQPICHRPVTGFDEVFTFDAGVVLQEGDEITARQFYNGDDSPPSPVPTVVQRLVGPFDGQRFISHIYRCGTSLFVAGVVPGATLEILDGGGTVIGSALSVDSGATIWLQSAIGNGESVRARQVVGGTVGGTVFSPRADPIPEPLWPIVEQPRACMTGIMVKGMMDGGELDVQTTAGDPSTTHKFRVPISELFLPLPSLVEGQKIEVREVLPWCEAMGDPQQFVVAPMSFDRAPSIVGPLCAGSVGIKVHGVVRGAELVARQGNTVLGAMIAYDADVEMTLIPLLATREPLVVTESLCGVSIASAPEPVEANPASPQPCDILEPLFDCSLTLWVQNGRPGAWTAAFSDQKGQISPWQVLEPDGKLTLSSALQTGHHISVQQTACGVERIRSNNEPEVQAPPGMGSPTIAQPLFADGPSILVENCIPGALVQVFTRQGGFLNSAIADTNGQAWVSKSNAHFMALADWHVYALQILCDQISEPGPDAVIVDRTPLQPIINAPGIGATGEAVRPVLKWTDPGRNTVRQAEKFLVEVTTPDHPLYDALAFQALGDFNTVTVDRDLSYSTRYIWHVIPAVGEPGWEVRGPTADGSFVVKGPPPPPPAPPRLLSVGHGSAARRYVVKGTSFLPSTPVTVRITGNTLAGDYFVGDAAGHPIRSDASGGLDVTIQVAALAPNIVKLYFAATDGRTNPADATGTLWTNTLELSAYP